MKPAMPSWAIKLIKWSEQEDQKGYDYELEYNLSR